MDPSNVLQGRRRKGAAVTIVQTERVGAGVGAGAGAGRARQQCMCAWKRGGLEWVRGCGVNHPPGALLAGENRYPFAWKCLAAAADLGRIPSSHGPSKQPFLCLALPWPCCPALPQARRALSTHPSPPLPIVPHGRARIAPFGILPKNHAATAPGQPSGLTGADKRSSPASRPTRTSREPQPQVHSAPLAFTSASTISLHRPPSTRPTPTPAMTSFFGRLKSGTVSALLPCLHAP